jgi:hypothetical protein
MTEAIKRVALAPREADTRVTVWRDYPLVGACGVDALVATHDHSNDLLSRGIADAGERYPGCFVLACNQRGMITCISPGILDRGVAARPS